MQAQTLMVSHPFSPNVVRALLAYDGSLQDPLLNEVVEQRRVHGAAAHENSITNMSMRFTGASITSGSSGRVVYEGPKFRWKKATISALNDR